MFGKFLRSHSLCLSALGLKVERRVKDEAYDAAYQSRIVSVAISRKKKLAIDAIANVVNGMFV